MLGFDDIPYDLILESDSPKNITNVSMLRHYVNVHGITKQLLDYSSLDYEDICCVIENVSGYIDFKDVIDDCEDVIQDAIEEKQKHRDAIIKNKQLIKQLKDSRTNFCGVGTRKIKLLLNKLIKNGDNVAKAYRLGLEIEDKNIVAKDTIYDYADRVYYQKHTLLVELIEFCIVNDFVYGVQDIDGRNTNAIVYFELPGMEQISFHTFFEKGHHYKPYDKEWDGEINSTLPKIEKAIINRYKDIIDNLKNK